MVVGDFVEEVDVLVVGAGPGGYVAAIRAAQLGKKVTIVDKDALGGVCLNRGCIPSKALISAAEKFEALAHGADIGIQADNVNLDYAKVQAWKDGIVQKQTGGVGFLLKGNNVEILSGEVFFIEENVASVSNDEEGKRLKFNSCIIATGTRPIELKTFPFGDRIISSTEALSLQEIPKSMVVIGGGYIGIELGQTYAKFGTKVTILEGADTILPGFEKEMTRFVSKTLKKSGVEVYNNAMAKSSEVTDNDVTVTFEVKGEEKQVTAEYVLVTVGRRPNTDQLGLENIGVKLTDRGLVEIDHQCKTSVPNIYAIGDIVEGYALAHKASYEGKVAAEVIAGKPSIIDYKAIPEVVFSDPEMASVGLKERDAKEKGIDIVMNKFNYGGNGRAMSKNATDGFVKVIAEKETGIVLGGQIVGQEASNLIAELGLAVEMGSTLEDISLTIHAHPSLGEIVMEAAEGALGHGVHQIKK
ncbi:dihydrolipoyl dehydrogenase [Chengkuizengella marina]|uniref:Dihydrolipoyl dehydrogenase n=1 Tax=Chengkuizengella marina TaxID=2507566 RepID=A0A6N9Q843_9BACL|nr:dihydrolipoyl dehydrogenase [Chengkuizengella marina]NBI31046.1 dihydrolipoyl dehydrogenase [Chengkuizengella marina]